MTADEMARYLAGCLDDASDRTRINSAVMVDDEPRTIAVETHNGELFFVTVESA